MADVSRLRHPVESWRQWYQEIVAAMSDLTPADVLARWVRMAAPSYQPLGLRPSEAMIASAPAYAYLEHDGTWWVRDEQAASAPGRNGISWDDAGPYLRLPGGQIVRDRAAARRHLGRHAADPTIALFLGLFLTGRQEAFRKTMSREVLARTLVILGLVEGGMPHLAAVRTWLRWESELGGWLSEPTKLALADLGSDADSVQRQTLRNYERSVATTNRRTWEALGLRPE